MMTQILQLKKLYDLGPLNPPRISSIYYRMVYIHSFGLSVHGEEMGLGTVGAALRRLAPIRAVEDIVRRLNEEPLAWWVDLAESEFRFLEQEGFELEKVHLHQQGNFVSYRNRDWVLFVSYEPDSTRHMDVTLVRTSELKPGSNPRFRSLRSILGDEVIELRRPPRELNDRQAVSETLRNWASALRENREKVFRGE